MHRLLASILGRLRHIALGKNKTLLEKFLIFTREEDMFHLRGIGDKFMALSKEVCDDWNSAVNNFVIEDEKDLA